MIDLKPLLAKVGAFCFYILLSPNNPTSHFKAVSTHLNRVDNKIII